MNGAGCFRVQGFRVLGLFRLEEFEVWVFRMLNSGFRVCGRELVDGGFVETLSP